MCKPKQLIQISATYFPNFALLRNPGFYAIYCHICHIFCLIYGFFGQQPNVAWKRARYNTYTNGIFFINNVQYLGASLVPPSLLPSVPLSSSLPNKTYIQWVQIIFQWYSKASLYDSAVDKQSVNNRSVNRETVIYIQVKNTPVKRQQGSKGSYIVICTLIRCSH